MTYAEGMLLRFIGVELSTGVFPSAYFWTLHSRQQDGGHKKEGKLLVGDIVFLVRIESNPKPPLNVMSFHHALTKLGLVVYYDRPDNEYPRPVFEVLA
jgi:hypothetical protein